MQDLPEFGDLTALLTTQAQTHPVPNGDVRLVEQCPVNDHAALAAVLRAGVLPVDLLERHLVGLVVLEVRDRGLGGWRDSRHVSTSNGGEWRPSQAAWSCTSRSRRR